MQKQNNDLNCQKTKYNECKKRFCLKKLKMRDVKKKCCLERSKIIIENIKIEYFLRMRDKKREYYSKSLKIINIEQKICSK